MATDQQKYDFDYIIIGSGFGGSVSALRLSEKGYKVLVIEKGKWFSSNDFAKTNWNLKRWLWIPLVKFHGIFKITFYRHVGILSGVGVGGGSLVYANTLQIPKKELEFYKSLKDLDVAKAGEEGDFIKIELVDCPPDVSRTQDDKCVLLKNDVYVPLSIYMKGIAEKNEKYLAQIKTENKENAKNPEEPRARHDILKKEL